MSRTTVRVSVLFMLVILTIAMLGALPATTLAATGDTGTAGGYSWTELADGTVSVTAYTGPGGFVVIPETLAGKTVSVIGYQAFQDCTSLMSITIPAGVTLIGDSAFWGCTALTSVTIPTGVTLIGGSAFYGCTSLTSVTIPASVTSIWDSAFHRCTSLTSVTIPTGVTSIGAGTFWGCTSLTSVAIPTGVTSIGAGTFYGCTSLTSVTIPASVTSIVGGDEYAGAFSGCTSLTSVAIPTGVTLIGGSAFYGCTSLTSVTIPAGVLSIDDDAFRMSWGSTSGRTFVGWYTAPSGGDLFDFVTPTIAETTIWARWSTTISTSVNNGSFGSVSGAGTYVTGSVATVTATPAVGCRFVSWTEGGSVVSAQPSYSFTVTAPHTLVANFEALPVTISAPVAPLTISAPIAPLTMYRTRYYTVYGWLKPRHVTYSVRIYKWRYVSGRWKSYGYVNAPSKNYLTYTKYSRSIRLPYAGKWRLRSYAAHRAMWSTKYDYVTVK